MAAISSYFGLRLPVATDPGRGIDQPRTALAITAALLAFLSFTAMDAIIKTLTQTYSLPQVIALNALFGLIPVAIIAYRRDGWHTISTRKPWLHALRASLSMAGAVGSVYAFSVLPMALVYVIIFAAPLFVTALSVPLLKEPVGWRRWSAVLVGFIGVMIILRPGLGGMSWAMLGALAGALAFAASVILIRGYGKGERATAFTFYLLLPQAIVYGVVAVGLDMVAMPSALDLGLSAAGGLLGGAAALLIAFALKNAPAATIAPFQYSQLLWGILLGYLFWQELPDIWVVVGGSIVVASGLYILHRETVVARRNRAAAATARRAPTPDVPATAAPVAR